MPELLHPKEITLTAQNGAEKTFILSKFPAVAGREIVCKYPLSNIPKLGDYAVSEETMLKLMAHVGVPRDDGTVLRLTTRALVDNHIPDWEVLAKIEVQMMEYNCSFFANGRASTFFDGIARQGKQLIFKTLTDFLGQLSQKKGQRSTN